MRRLIQVFVMWLACSGCSGPDPDRNLPPEYRALPVPAEDLRAEESRQRGRVLFVEHCALCHGERADGRGVRREGFARAPRDLTSTAWRRSTTPRHVYYSIREGVRDSAMPAWKALDPAQTWDLVAYILSLSEERQ
jgi:mono/diheme cytochrome c family protein